MATFTITVDTNIDAITGKAGADTYNINGPSLTLDQDTRNGQNTSSTTGYIGAMSPSATLGGTVKVEGRYVRLLYFTGGSGTVPAYNTTISQGGASGLLIGVYSNLTSAPVAPGGAMPTSGYIKIKQWNSVSFASGALTGITATNALDPIFSTYDRAGWIEIVTRGQVATNWSMNRLNNANDPVCNGLPYLIGITDGNRSTTYQIPTNGVLQYHAGVFVETGTGTDEWEFYPVTNDTMVSTNVPTSALKGKWCKIDPSTGVVRFGHDGTNSSGGYVPPSGRKVAIGNIFMTLCDNATPAQNYYNATASARGRFITTGAGRIEANWTSFNFGFAAITNAQYLELNHCGLVDTITVTNPALAPIFTNGGIGCPQGYLAGNFNAASIPVGAVFTDYVIGKSGHSTTANSYMFSGTDITSFSWTDCKFLYSGARGASTQFAVNVSRGEDLTFEDCIVSYGMNIASTQGLSWTGGHYFYSNIPNDILQATYMMALSTLASDVLMENIAIADGDLPRNGLLSTGSSSADITLRNIGTRTSPIGSGVAEGVDVTWARSGTTATVTFTNHGLAVGDIIMVTRSDSVAAISRTSYTVASVPTANTFTFTCTNAGNTSGKLSYYLTQLVRIALLSSTDNVKIQNVHARTIRTATISPDNTVTNLYVQNVTTNWESASAIAATGNNMRFNATSHDPTTMTGGNSVYGTHMRSGYLADLGVPSPTGVSWTRVTGTVTVTSPNHGLYTSSRIQVMDTTNPGGMPTVGTVSVTVLDKDTFTFTGANSGATSGTLTYRTADGALFIDGNEPNELSASQFSIIAGTPLFTGTGGLAMFNVNDQVQWESEYPITDFVSAANMMLLTYGATQANHEFYYDIDLGSGYSGVFNNLYIQRSGGAGTSGTAVVTVTSTAGVNVGDYVYGVNVHPNAKVVSVDSGTQLTLDNNNLGTVSGILYFNHLPNVSSIPDEGFMIKIRCKTITANVLPLTFVRIFFNSDADSRDNLYPQDAETYNLRIRGIPEGSIVAIYDSSDNELARDDNVTSGFFDYTYVHEGTDIEDVYYVVWHEDYQPFKSDPFDLTAADIGLSFTAILDRVYTDTYDANYSINFGSKLIIMGSGETEYDVQGAYSYWKEQITLADNFTYDFAFEAGGNNQYDPPRSTPILTGLLNGWKIRPDEADHTLEVVDGILYVVGGGDPFVDTMGAYTVRVSYQAPISVLTITSGSGVLPTDVTAIAEAVEDLIQPEIDEILSNSDATQAKVDQL